MLVGLAVGALIGTAILTGGVSLIAVGAAGFCQPWSSAAYTLEPVMAASCEPEIRELAALTDGLLTLVGAATERNATSGAPADSLAVIERYRAKLSEGMTEPSDQSLLAAANLLTTVNRGLADAVWVDSHPEIAAAALEVTRSATLAARCLRGALGMTF